MPLEGYTIARCRRRLAEGSNRGCGIRLGVDRRDDSHVVARAQMHCSPVLSLKRHKSALERLKEHELLPGHAAIDWRLPSLCLLVRIALACWRCNDQPRAKRFCNQPPIDEY